MNEHRTLEAGYGTDTGGMNSNRSPSSSGQDDSQAREATQIPLTLTYAKITLLLQFPQAGTGDTGSTFKFWAGVLKAKAEKRLT